MNYLIRTLFLFTIWIGATIKLNGQIDISRNSGCAPLSDVQFTSPANTVNPNWDFGDGASANQLNVAHSYGNPGEYEVVFTGVVNGNPVTEIDTIVVFGKPTALFEPTTDTIGCIPFTVNFGNQSTSNAGFTSYEWTFGDGGSSADENPEYDFTLVGDFTVSLVVTDTNGCNNSFVMPQLVTTHNPPVANFSTQAYDGCVVPVSVTYDNTSTNGAGNINNLTYEWDFANGQTSGSASPTSSFIEAGSYPVSLTVTDEFGCQASRIRNVSVGGPVASFEVEDTLCIDNIYSINNTSSGNSFTWDFGDGQSSNQRHPSIEYMTAGLFDINLIARAGACSDDTTITIFVEEVIADFTSNPSFTCEAPMCIDFSPNSSPNAVSFNWHFQDGAVSNDPNPNHCYSIDTNRYTVHDPYFFETQLIATSVAGCSDQIRRTDTLYPLSAFFQPDVYQGCAPLTVNFSDSSRSASPITSWSYDFGNGASSSQQNPTYTFNNPGTYEVTLAVTNQAGCFDEDYTVEIQVGDVTNLNFSLSANPVCIGDEVTVTDLSTDPNIDFWDYRIDGFSIGNCPSGGDVTWEVNSNPGNHTMTLTTVHNGCESSTDQAIIVNGAIPHISYDFVCENPLDYHLIGSIEGIAADWTFSIDGNPLAQNADSSRSYSFPSSGDYWVSLETNTPACPNLVDSTLIRVREIQADITADIEACADVSFQVNAINSQDVDNRYNRGYKWIYADDEAPMYSTSSVFNFEPSGSGADSIILVTRDVNQCRDTAVFHYEKFDITAGFDTIAGPACLPWNVNFIDTSIADANIVAWEWTFDDGSTDNSGPNVFNEYTDPDIEVYRPHLRVEDEHGCWDTISYEIFPVILNPTISRLTDHTVCVGDSIRYRLNNTTNLASWTWNFGEGSTDNSNSAILYHTFNIPGNFTISAYVESAEGCEDSVSVANLARIQDYPDARIFSPNDIDDYLCFPSTVTFRDSTPINPDALVANRIWNLGGGGAYLPNVSVSTTYTEKGDYHVSLIALTSFGCADTAFDTLQVIGPEANFSISDDLICINESIDFQITDTSDVGFFAWDFGNGQTLSGNIGNPSALYDFVPNNGSTVVQLLYWGEDSVCPSARIDTINIYDVMANFGHLDSIICHGQNLSLVDSSSNADTYFWDFGNGTNSENANPPAVNYDQPGDYLVQLFIENTSAGCLDTFSRTYTVYPLPALSSQDIVGCMGDLDTLSAFGADFYQWSPNEDIIGSDSSEIAVIEYTQTKNYTLIGTDSIGCIDSIEVLATSFGLPETVVFDSCIVIGEEITIGIDLGDAFVYDWSSGNTDFLECMDCPTQTIQPLEENLYTLTYTDTLGCYTDFSEFDVCVNPVYSVDVPDAFTPNNGDGVNDLVFVDGWGIKELIEFTIYNRWGEIVFQTNDINQGWDGTYSGAKQDSEVFIYKVVVEYYGDGGRGSATGNITLLR